MRILSRSTNYILAGMITILAVVGGSIGLWQILSPQDSAVAISARDFQAGRIIDDEIFYNKDSMTVWQIQELLNHQVPTCDTYGTQPASDWGRPDITRATYAKERWNISPPFICLKDYYENPKTKETSYEKGPGRFSGSLSAAEIIYRAAQQHGINPQVLITLLRKESAGPLTNDPWPFKRQYRFAMGYACPDSGPGHSANCDDTKAGFYNQMMTASWQLQYYKQHPNDYRYGIGWNDIQYSPNPSCGTKRVKIENIATLSLYIYTPYTPNDASLANYPGAAHCGSYGNRNFFMFFHQWFGSPVRQAEPVGQALKSNIAIPAGYYTITVSSRKTVTAQGKENGAKLTLLHHTGSINQQFFIKSTNDGYYALYADLANNKVLDLPESSTRNETAIQLWDYHGGCNQKWTLHKRSGGAISLLSACNSLKAIDVHGGDITKDGTVIQLFNHHGGSGQRWQFQPIEAPVANSTRAFISPSGKQLDVKESLSSNGSAIILWQPHTGNNQRFAIEKSRDGFYIIRSLLNTNRVLDIYNSSMSNGSKIQLWDYHGGCNQKWTLHKRSGGAISLLSVCNSLKAIDVHGGDITKDGTVIQLWDYHGEKNQQWHL